MVIKMELLSVIVPSYNEEENIFDFYEELMKNAPFFQSRELDVEVIYIDDGSKDKTAEKVKELAARDARVHLVSFSRNFGKEAAIYAGLKKAKGAYSVLMDPADNSNRSKETAYSRSVRSATAVFCFLMRNR